MCERNRQGEHLGPRPPRDGTGWGAGVVRLWSLAVGSPGCKPHLLTGTWHSTAWFTLLIRQTLMSNVNVGTQTLSIQSEKKKGDRGRRKAAVFGHLQIMCWTLTAAAQLRLLYSGIFLSPLTVVPFTTWVKYLLPRGQCWAGCYKKVISYSTSKLLPLFVPLLSSSNDSKSSPRTHCDSTGCQPKCCEHLLTNSS